MPAHWPALGTGRIERPVWFLPGSKFKDLLCESFFFHSFPRHHHSNFTHKWNATSPNARVRVEGTGKNDGLYLNLFPMGFPSPITKTKHREIKTKNLAESSRLSLQTSAVVFVQLTPPKTILSKYTPATVLHPWSLQRKIPFDFESSMQC